MRFLLGVASALWVAGTGFAGPLAAKAPAEVQALLPGLKNEVSASAAPVFWQRNSRTALWVMLVNDGGQIIVRAPPALGGYDGGFVVRLAPETYVLTLTSPSGRRVSSSVQMYALGGDTLTPAFTCESPQAPLWNSSIYFVDFDADGTLDLLIDREVNLDGARTRERLLYRYDYRRRTFREAIALPSGLAAALTAAEANPSTPKAVQYTLPYLTDVVH